MSVIMKKTYSTENNLTRSTQRRGGWGLFELYVTYKEMWGRDTERQRQSCLFVCSLFVPQIVFVTVCPCGSDTLIHTARGESTRLGVDEECLSSGTLKNRLIQKHTIKSKNKTVVYLICTLQIFFPVHKSHMSHVSLMRASHVAGHIHNKR